MGQKKNIICQALFVALSLYPDEWELLLDSDDYQGSLLGSVFLEREFDGDNPV